MIPLKKKNLLLVTLLVITASWKQLPVKLADLAKQKQKIQSDVLRALPKANYLAKYSYQDQLVVVKSYPVYFFSGSAATLRQSFDVSAHLSLDTASAYAAIYVHNNLKLEAQKLKTKYYSFYPIEPPMAANYKGLGIRKLTDYDIVLAQAAAAQSETAFFLNFSALGNDWGVPPTVIGFFKQHKLCFIDKDAKVYESFEDLVTARYGGKEEFIKMLEREENLAKQGKVLLVK